MALGSLSYGMISYHSAQTIVPLVVFGLKLASGVGQSEWLTSSVFGAGINNDREACSNEWFCKLAA